MFVSQHFNAGKAIPEAGSSEINLLPGPALMAEELAATTADDDADAFSLAGRLAGWHTSLASHPKPCKQAGSTSIFVVSDRQSFSRLRH